MKFLNYIEKQFARVLAVDTEFILDTTKTIPESVICFCYTDIFSGEVFRFWEHNKKVINVTLILKCLTGILQCNG